MDQARLSGVTTLADLGLAPFRPRAPWWNGDLQTLRNFLIRTPTHLADYPQERLLLPLNDGSGDALSAALSRPNSAARRPLVVLIHGLSGDENSFYMRRTAAYLLGLGYRVLRLNLRGAGASRAYCRFHYHAGRSEDLALLFASLPPALTGDGLVAVGISLGANVLLKYLGERGAATPLMAAAAVSAPLDLIATARRLRRWRNAAYQLYLIRFMRAEALAPIAELTAGERRAIRTARSIWEFDDRFSAPRHGFAGAEDYYERNAARHFIADIKVPTLVIHALDDPWIPPDAYYAVPWQANRHLIPLVSRRGGHVGFEGRDRRVPWHDLAIGRFLATLSRS